MDVVAQKPHVFNFTQLIKPIPLEFILVVGRGAGWE